AELVAQKPQTLQALGTISGIGARKLADYGEGFLAVVLAHPDEPAASAPVGSSALESAALLRQGLTPEQVAEQRGLAASTVYRHLSDVIQSGELALEEVVSLDPATLAQIHAAFEQFPDQGLKVVFEALEGRIDYPVLHCVRASMTAKR
ncbi:MAG: helix-turn-helix domain-containing protein, partial [Pseudomonadota bacterium]|nr:helix-turn-helix domain-containing protein [Pseudomonadota bacterium]